MKQAGDMPLDVRVRWEIWASFVSLLRAYTGATGKPYMVHSSADWAKVEHEGRAMRFCFQPTTGEAIWRSLRSDQEICGSFTINQDGTLGFADGPKALDLAAIDWIEQLGKADTNEVSRLC